MLSLFVIQVAIMQRLTARNDRGPDRQLHARVPQVRACALLGHAVHFEQYPTGTHLEDVVLRVAFPTAHTHLRGLCRYRTVGKEAGPGVGGLRGWTGEHRKS